MSLQRLERDLLDLPWIEGAAVTPMPAERPILGAVVVLSPRGGPSWPGSASFASSSGCGACWRRTQDGGGAAATLALRRADADRRHGQAPHRRYPRASGDAAMTAAAVLDPVVEAVRRSAAGVELDLRMPEDLLLFPGSFPRLRRFCRASSSSIGQSGWDGSYLALGDAPAQSRPGEVPQAHPARTRPCARADAVVPRRRLCTSSAATRRGRARRARSASDGHAVQALRRRPEPTIITPPFPVIVARLRERGLPVFLIDDASDEPARGASGRAACARGRHHACTGCGQPRQGRRRHRRLRARRRRQASPMRCRSMQTASTISGRCRRCLRRAAHQPEAIVLGAPVYDATMPIGRRIGRWITHVWVCVETLSPRVLDTMCGFRVYPLAPTMALLRRGADRPADGFRSGNRGPSDLARRAAGRPCRSGVRYPEDNLSNFRLLRDNWAITRMHTRLVLTCWRACRGSCARAPAARKRRATGRAWASAAPIGGCGSSLPLLPADRPPRLHGMLLPVVLYFHMTGAAAAPGLARLSEPRLCGARREARALARSPRCVTLSPSRASARDVRRLDRRYASARRDRGRGRDRRVLSPRARGLLLIVSHLGNVESQPRRARMTTARAPHGARAYPPCRELCAPAAALSAARRRSTRCR